MVRKLKMEEQIPFEEDILFEDEEECAEAEDELEQCVTAGMRISNASAEERFVDVGFIYEDSVDRIRVTAGSLFQVFGDYAERLLEQKNCIFSVRFDAVVPEPPVSVQLERLQDKVLEQEDLIRHLLIEMNELRAQSAALEGSKKKKFLWF